MDEHHALSLLRDIGLGIVFAAACSHVAKLLKQPLLLGYVVAGILLGSNLGFGLITSQESIELISEIGLIFLLFIIGLEINLRELVGMGKAMFTLGVVQFAGCVLLGFAFFKLLGYNLAGGNFDLLYFSVAAALSSTLIVVKLLHDKFEINTVAGKLTVGVLVLQDVWAILFMALQPNIQNLQPLPILKSIGSGILLVALAFTLSRFVLNRLFHSSGKSPELVLLTSMAWCFVVAGFAKAIGLSMEMGALIAGVSIAAFPYGADVISKLSGVRDFFVTLFFVALGLKVLAPTWQLAGLGAMVFAFIVASRLVTIAPLVYALKRGQRNGFRTALNLSQMSEFSLVILALGVGYGHVSQELSSTVLVCMLLGAIFSTYIIQFNDPLTRVLVRGAAMVGWKDSHANEREGKKISQGELDIALLGCFRDGMSFLNAVEESAPEMKERILVVDYDPALGKRLEARGFHWAYGDLAHPDTLHHLGIEHSTLIVCSISDTFLKGTNNHRLLGHLKHLAPNSTLVMAADDKRQAEKLESEGAHHVLVSAELSGRHLFNLVRETAPSKQPA